MIIDSSAILTILLAENDAEVFAEAIVRAQRRLIGSFSHLECSAVLLARKGSVALSALQAFMFRSRIQEVGFAPEQCLIAVDAYRRYGKGKHPAALNLGDCCSYALAKALDLPLLYKGNDFSKTDIVSALPNLS